MTGVAMRRRDLVALLVGIALIASASPAHDADYPNRSVRVIVPYPAGGPTDLIARLAAQMLTESLGQDFFVENVSGASGVRGALMVAAAPGDGYTLMVTTSDLGIAPVMSTKVGYDALKNFVPASFHARRRCFCFIRRCRQRPCRSLRYWRARTRQNTATHR